MTWHPPPHASLQFGHILFFNQYLSQISQWSLWPKLIPQTCHLQVFGIRGKVRTEGGPFHPLHSQNLEVVSDKVFSVGVGGLSS